MSPLVLIGSLSESRLVDYQATLESYGIRTGVVSNDQDCFEQLARHPRGSLLIECSMIWNGPGSEGSDTDGLQNEPDVSLVLFAGSGRTAQPADDVRMPVLGLFQQFPSREELLSAISSAQESGDAFIFEKPGLRSEPCPR